MRNNIQCNDKGKDKTKKNKNTVTRSLKTKYGWKAILSSLEFIPIGFDDPCSCKVKRCITTKAANTKGNK